MKTILGFTYSLLYLVTVLSVSPAFAAKPGDNINVASDTSHEEENVMEPVASFNHLGIGISGSYLKSGGIAFAGYGLDIQFMISRYFGVSSEISQYRSIGKTEEFNHKTIFKTGGWFYCFPFGGVNDTGLSFYVKGGAGYFKTNSYINKTDQMSSETSTDIMGEGGAGVHMRIKPRLFKMFALSLYFETLATVPWKKEEQEIKNSGLSFNLKTGLMVHF